MTVRCPSSSGPFGFACCRRAIAVGFAMTLSLTDASARADCVETGTAGADRPQISDAFPDRALSGYVVPLHVTVTHGAGETVLPHGLELQRESDAARALKAAGFVLPEQDAGAGARLARTSDKGAGRLTSTLDLPLVALPKEPGRHTLILPPLPIAVARANGDVVTLCTQPHPVIVDDPTSSTPDAQPKPNPAPRKQREEWIALERALAFLVAGAILGGLALLLFRRWQRRPRVAPPPPPPRVPWELALERLDEARHAGLLETNRFAEFFDRVNDAVREYLGARYAFDGLESTTDETLKALERVANLAMPVSEIALFLQQCDLVKFADLTPSLEECQTALTQAEHVVRATIPRSAPPLGVPRPAAYGGAP